MSFLWKKNGTWTPWGYEARQILEETEWRVSEEESQNYVILKWLMRGEVKPLAAYCAGGKAPAPFVLAYLAGMLDPQHIGKLKLTDEHGDIPVEYRYRLIRDNVPGKQKRKKRKGEHEKRPETEIRDFDLAKKVDQYLLARGSNKEAAYKAVAEASNVGDDTVKDAYLRFMGRGKPGLSLLKRKVGK